MAFGFCFGVTILLSVWFPGNVFGLKRNYVTSDSIPDRVLNMECHDRYLMIAVDLSFTREEPRFEAVDGAGVYPITKQYAAKCGYNINVLPLPDRMELRASYLSCHTDNKDDKVFTFHFNLIAKHEEQEVTYALNKTCFLTLPWSPREVTCELNYMEVSVRSEITCASGMKKDDWNALQPAHSSTTSDWQVMFQKAEEQTKAMNLSVARKLGYTFDVMDGRILFRTPYGQPDSFNTELNGVPVEVVHATLFSRQSWVVLMVDLVAACSMYEGLYDESGYMMWETPEALHPLVFGLHGTHFSFGLNGKLMEQPVAEERGYIMEKHNNTVQINIPYNAEGGYRKSVVSGDLFEFYIFNLYLEQILVDEDQMETRLRFHRTLATPLLPCPVFTVNQTILEERVFTIYLGDVPEDAALAAVVLNGHNWSIPLTNTSMHMITEVVHLNNTCGYTLKVPFDDPVVIRQLSKEEAVLQYRLDINYTLMVLPEKEPFYHMTTITALFTDVSPPQFDAVCTESGISFRLDHRPFDYMWHITIGSDLLTSKLAAQHGYIMSNDSQSLHLDVPLFTYGYEYKDFTLKGFHGSFEILVRDHESLEIQTSTVKTCPFTKTELIMCSTDGWMTVVADLSVDGAIPAKTNLVDKQCRPREADDTRALFSVPLNSCGSVVKLGQENVTYENEILYSSTTSEATGRVIVQCTYPLEGLHRLFSVYRFESDTAGTGKIIHPVVMQSAAVPQIPMTVLQTEFVTQRPAKRPASFLPAAHPPVRYVKVFRVQNINSLKRS